MNAEEVLRSREAALWAELRRDGATAARETLFELHLPFARRIARRHHRDRSGAGIEYGDLVQLACAGLLEAIDRFDPACGVPFEGFASQRISGIVLDGIACSSEVQEQQAARRRIRSERLRAVTPAGDLDRRPTRDVMDAMSEMAVGLALGFMLDFAGHSAGDDMKPPGPRANPYETVSWNENVARLAAEVDALADRERRIVRLHYLDGLGFDLIADLMGVTRGRISQIHRATLTTLRKRLLARRQFRWSEGG